MSESNNRPRAIDPLCREAVRCRACFDHGALRPSTIDLAQPRWIGDQYWTASPRVCVVMLNPGAGTNHNEEPNRRTQALLDRFRSGESGLDDVFSFQRNDFRNWGNPPGRYLNFFRTFGLDIDRIALVNVAWCATANNRYPGWMLKACMERFTGRLLHLLNPNIVLLSGTKTWVFDAVVKTAAPGAKVFRTLHYAHRKRHEVEIQEGSKFRELIASH